MFKGAKFIDPRVEYDRHSGRFWLLYFGSDFNIHLAISEGPEPEGFDPADPMAPGEGWHIYTDATGYPAPFNPASTSISQDPLEGIPDHPAISFDPDYMYLVVNDAWVQLGPPDVNMSAGGIVVFPRTHDGGTKSILNGERPADSDLAGIELEHLPDPFPDDLQYFHYPVQEPFEDVAGQFYIVTAKGARYGDSTDPFFGPGFWDKVHDQIRLGGLYFNSGTGAWEYVFRDMDVPAAADNFFNPGQPVSGDAALPATPDSGWKIRTLSSKFDSGSLARDVNGNLKIFAGHHVVATNQSEGPLLPVDRHEFRYYVIAPDLGNFPGSGWDPTIEVVGVAPTGGVANAETYEGAIAVNADGIAYITFTRSGTGNDGWPSLVRARLSNNYTTTLFEQSGQAGPEQIYDDGGPFIARGLGLDYCDIQADYLHCGFWGVGTIAAFTDDEPEPPLTTSARAIWVTEILACNSFAEMTGDGTVDEFDLALYLQYYAEEDPRADMDRSGTITTADYQRYSAEYAKR